MHFLGGGGGYCIPAIRCAGGTAVALLARIAEGTYHDPFLGMGGDEFYTAHSEVIVAVVVGFSEDRMMDIITIRIYFEIK